MAAPTHDDAVLMLELAQWGSALGVYEAIARVFADDFDPQMADALEDEAVRTLLTFGESIGTLTRHNLLSSELMNDWIWFQGIWDRVGPAAVRGRQEMGEPRLYENLESLAAS